MSCVTCEQPTEMYLLVRVDFDSEENRSPEVFRNVGVYKDREKLEAKLAEKVIQYQGYNKGWYPRFEVEVLEVLG